jgi:hypothetical protein
LRDYRLMTLGTFAPAMVALASMLVAGRALAALMVRPASVEISAVLVSLAAAILTPALLWLMLNRLSDAGMMELF